MSLRQALTPMRRYAMILFIGFLIAGCGNSGSTASSVTISGTVTYEDKLYGAGGFLTTGTTTTFKPVRFAEVEAVNAKNAMVLATGMTDTAGFYTIQILPVAVPVYMRVKSTAAPGAFSLAVHDYEDNLYAVPGSDFVPKTTTTADISIALTNQVSAAFNILDVFITAVEFVNSLAGTYPPPLTAYWSPAGLSGSDIGTFYCTGSCPRGEGIYVLGNYQGDTDGYDDDVLWHEYGHFIANKFSKDDSPGGVHRFTDNYLDLRLSWSEGWGDFFPVAVKNWLFTTGRNARLSTEALSHYVDTNGSGYVISFDFAAIPVSDLYLYASSEAAVARILWVLMAGDASLPISALGMQPIWDVFHDFSASVPSTAIPWTNLEAFWDRWIALRNPDAVELATLKYVFSERSIRYYEDPSEPDDTSGTATPITIGTPATGTLYKAAGRDRDYFRFTVSAADAGRLFTIKTAGLQNGADTYLTLYNSGMFVIKENDNPNDIVYEAGVNYDYYDNSGNYVYPWNTSTTLSSVLQFNPTAGTYYVEVTSSPNAPKSAGRYGTYTLNIQ